MGFIKRAWKGEEKLWEVFWLYCVLLGMVLNMIAKFLAATAGISPVAPIIILAPYSLWSLVSLWRCAFNVKTRIFGYLARVYVVLLLLGILNVAVGGALIGTDLIQCKKALADRAVASKMDVNQYIDSHQDEMKRCMDKGVDALNSSASTVVPPVSTPAEAVLAPVVPAPAEVTTPAPVMVDAAAPANSVVAEPAPATAPTTVVAPAPVVSPMTVPAAAAVAPAAACEKKMSDYAAQQQVDPKTYIAQNQAYLQQCIQFMTSNPGAKQ